MEPLLKQILDGLKPFDEFLSKNSYGRTMTIVGFAIIVLTIVLPFLPFLHLSVDYETKSLFIVTGLILIFLGGLFLFLDKILITRFKQKCALLLLDNTKSNTTSLNDLLKTIGTDDERATTRS